MALVGSILLFRAIKPRKDLTPNYLAGLLGDYFDRGGFCFNFTIEARGGHCILNTYFQNQYDHRCFGRIALRPTKGFFLTRAKFEAIQFDIECEPAAFGVSSREIPIPAKFQGRKQTFEVGASVVYPEGKRQLLRYGSGFVLRSNSSFQNSFGTTLTVAGALAGMVVLSSPMTVNLTLPTDVKEELPEDLVSLTRTIWKLHDAPLTAEA